MKDIFFELVGPNYNLAKAEIISLLDGLSYRYNLKSSEPGILTIKTDCPVEIFTKRLGLIHRVFDHLGNYDDDISKIEDDLEFPPGSIAVRTKKLGKNKGDSRSIKEELGRLISIDHQIDLEDPKHEVFVLMGKKNYVGLKKFEVDKESLRSREVKNRPFSSPISLKPRYTKALINLARPGENAKIHDPFCGTGGILIEGELMNFSVTGGDKDKKMIEGCKKNLKEYDIQAPVYLGDVSKTIPDDIDCIVTDPPYGRASSTLDEDITKIYKRLFESSKNKLKQEGFLSAIFPDEKYLDIGREHMDFVEKYDVRVHKSLTRHFSVFQKK